MALTLKKAEPMQLTLAGSQPSPLQVVAGPNMQHQAPPPQQDIGSFLSGLGSWANQNLIKPTLDTGARVANQLGAAGAGIYGLGDIALNHGSQDAQARTQANINYFLGNGVGGVGGYQRPETVGSGDITTALIKPVAQATAEVAPLVVPFGGLARGANLATRMLVHGATNATVGGASDITSQLASTGRVDPMEALKAAGLSGVFGATVPAAGALASKVRVGLKGQPKVAGPLSKAVSIVDKNSAATEVPVRNLDLGNRLSEIRSQLKDLPSDKSIGTMDFNAKKTYADRIRRANEIGKPELIPQIKAAYDEHVVGVQKVIAYRAKLASEADAIKVHPSYLAKNPLPEKMTGTRSRDSQFVDLGEGIGSVRPGLDTSRVNDLPVVKAKRITTDTTRPPVAATGTPEPVQQFQAEAPRNTALQSVKAAQVDADQVLLDHMKALDKASPVPDGQLTREQKFMYDSNMQRGSHAVANYNFENSPHVQEALGGLSKDDYRAFSDYANARTELSTADKTVATSRPKAELQQIVASATPEHQARFEALNQHFKELAGVARDAGIIDENRYQSYVKNNDYVRLQRDMGDLVPTGRGAIGNGYQLGSTKTTLARKGSTRDTLPVGEAAAQYTQQVYKEAAKNKTGTRLVDALVESGLSQKLKGTAEATNKNTISVFRNGKKEFYQVPADIKEAVNNINPYQLGTALQIAAIPGRIARAGITGLNPVFIARNLFKDQVGSAINSEHAFWTHNPKVFAEGLVGSMRDALGLGHNELYADFLKHYGDQTSYDLARNPLSAKTAVNRIRGGAATAVAQKALHPIRTLEDIASVTEKSTRFQQYVGEYRKGIKDGLTHADASERAALAAWQNSVDFSRAGTFGRVLNTVIPYWNPAVQGVRQEIRTFKNHPVGSTFKGIATIGIPLAAATAWNLSDPETKKVYDNIQPYEKDNNFIIVLPGAKQNGDKSYDVIKIPLAPGWKDAFMPFRRGMESYMNDKPLDGQQVFTDLLQSLSGPVSFQSPEAFAGSFIPQAAKPVVQQYLNKDLYTGNAIVPDNVNSATDATGNPIPENKKAYKNSSGTAELVGNALGVSPIRVEKAVKDIGGAVGLNLLNASDQALAANGTISPDNIGGQSVVTGFKKSFGQAAGINVDNPTPAQQYYIDLKAATGDLNANEQAAYKALHPQSKNFLGDQIYNREAAYDPAARLDIYNRYPKVFEADKALNDAQAKAGSPSNPLFTLSPEQVKKVLEKDNLPAGATDPELSKLKDQPWYQDYQAQRSTFYSQLAEKAKAAGKPFGSSSNPYPTTPPATQRAFDYYANLPKGTGARSSWIKANPEAWNAMQAQYAAVDGWQNAQRGLRGLDTTQGSAGTAKGYAQTTATSTTSSSSSRRTGSSAARRAMSRATYGGEGGGGGGSSRRMKVASSRRSKAMKIAAYRTPKGTATRPKVSLKKSKV